MAFAKGVWKLLVGIKDGLVLVFMLLFFLALYAALTARPGPAQVHAGALLVDLDGTIVEERAAIDPLSVLLSGTAPVQEYDAQDLVRAIDSAAGDDRIKAVALDLSRFLGGGQVHLQTVGAALDRFRAAGKPVLAYGMVMGDDAIQLASHASEVWLDPMGGALVTGPGGSNLYYAGLLDRLDIDAHVYKVGTYKSAVEPYTRSSMSPEARENAQALYGALWEEWQANVKKARPRARIDRIAADPVAAVEAAQGDLAQAALATGLVDKLGNRVQFGQRVAQTVGEDKFSTLPGAFAHTDLDPWLADNPAPTTGKAIGVVTIAGRIVDGDAGPGTAGGTRIADLLDQALDSDLAGLVVRIDSPGGSVTASEDIRLAIARFKAKGIPVAVSMGNVAASGGYWVATPGQRIFAEPETITGSIGIFAVLPTFERLAAKYGVTSDGVRTTPLSGQPDVIAGLTPEVNTLLQSTIEHGYTDFLRRVSASRNMTLAQVDRVGQGRVWDGGSARQLNLVDQFGGLDDAANWVAGKAGLANGDWHLDYLGSQETTYDTLLRTLLMPSGTDASARIGAGRDLFAFVGARQGSLIDAALATVRELVSVQGAQAYCLACPQPRADRGPPGAGAVEDRGWLMQLATWVEAR